MLRGSLAHFRTGRYGGGNAPGRPVPFSVGLRPRRRALDAFRDLPATIDVALALRTIALSALARAPKVNPQGIPADRGSHGLVRIGGEPTQQRVGAIKLPPASNRGGEYHDVVHGIADIVFDVVPFAKFRQQRQSHVRRLSAERN